MLAFQFLYPGVPPAIYPLTLYPAQTQAAPDCSRLTYPFIGSVTDLHLLAAFDHAHDVLLGRRLST
jgi:hypothetical protein